MCPGKTFSFYQIFIHLGVVFQKNRVCTLETFVKSDWSSHVLWYWNGYSHLKNKLSWTLLLFHLCICLFEPLYHYLYHKKSTITTQTFFMDKKERTNLNIGRIPVVSLHVWPWLLLQMLLFILLLIIVVRISIGNAQCSRIGVLFHFHMKV